MRNLEHQLKNKRTGEFYRVLTLRTLGNFLIFSSLFMIGKTFYQPVREEVRYFVDQVTHKKYVVVSKLEVKNKKVFNKTVPGGLTKALDIQNVEVLTPQDPNFSVVIPAIGANSRIIKNVDPGNETEYLTALQKGVAHAAGTAFPGEGGHIFLFAHSTDYIWNVGTYNAVFYLLYKVKLSDEIDIFYKGQRYVYQVIDKKIVDPSQVEYLTRKTNKEFLTLQTCWPPGTALKRLLVFATRVVD